MGTLLAGTLPVTSPAHAEETVVFDEPEAREALAEHVRAATAHFERREFAAAEAEFGRALALATSDPERATLEFNLASCAFELGRFAEAEAAFLRSASLDPTEAELARLDAGFAAAKDGRLAAAEQHLAAAEAARGTSHDPEVGIRRAELMRELDRLRAALATADRDRPVREAAEALQGGDPARAAQLLERLLAALPAAGITPAEIADLYYGLAAAYLALGDLAPARTTIDRAIAAEPTDADLYAKRGQLCLLAGDRRCAKRDLERALDLGATGATAAWARAELAKLEPRPRRGPLASLYVGGGFDSNPAQSGITDQSGVTSAQTSKGSGFVSAYGALGYTARFGERMAGRALYSPSLFVLTSPEVTELGMQGHEVAGHLFLATSPRTLFRFSAMSSFLLSGFDAPERFLWENGGGIRMDRRTGEHTRTRLEVQARAVQGFEDQEVLTGAREELAWLELVDIGDVSLTAGLRLRAVQAGVVERALTAEDFPVCGAVCDGASYEIPLSYLAPGGMVDVVWSVGPRLGLGASASMEWRQYLDESAIRLALGGAGAGSGGAGGGGRAEGAKTRHDLRVRPGVHAEVGLDRGDHVALMADYSLLVSESNVAYDPDDPEHAFDYDDRQFVQHVVEGGIEARF